MATVTEPFASSLSVEKRRSADVAFDAIESLIVCLQIAPGSPVVEADIVHMTGLTRTPVREALMRMVSGGLITPQPRRGLVVAPIDVRDHLDVITTRRALERLIASHSARRATSAQRQDLVQAAREMAQAAAQDDLDAYMRADQNLDRINHAACGNRSAAFAVRPLVVHCRRFWYAYQHAGEMMQDARAHLEMVRAIASGDEAAAADGAGLLMDYLEQFARRAIDS